LRNAVGDVRFVPRGLFDHLVSELLQLRSHVDPERSGGLEVDHQLEFGRLLHRQIGRLGPLSIFCPQAQRLVEASPSGPPRRIREH
jgi:hypothetical protein